MRRVTLWRSLAAGSVLLATGCGLNTSSSPEPLPEEAVPSELGGDQEEEDVAADVTQVDEQVPFSMWLVDQQHEADRQLVPQEIPVQVDPQPRLVLESLLEQPTDELSENQGLTTSIPGDTTVNDIEPGDEEGEIVVDLSAEFYDDPEDGRGRYAFGQVVLTLTELPGVDSVSFLRDGEEFTARDGRGAEVDGDEPVIRGDYRRIVTEMSAL